MRELVARPRPRALYIEIDPSVFEATRGLFGTHRVVDDLSETNLGDWDVLVTGAEIEMTTGVASRLHMITFAEGELGVASGSKNPVRRATTVRRGQVLSVASQVVMPDDLAEPYARLVPRLAADRDGTEPHSCLTAGLRSVQFFGGFTEDEAEETILHPILATSDGFSIAAWWVRPENGVALSLPPDLSSDDEIAWIRAGVTLLREVDPDAFPVAESAWIRDPAWLLPDETASIVALESAQEERRRELARLDAAIVTAVGNVEKAHASVDSGLRRLLTATGDDLHAGVIEALGVLGFGVQNMDDVWPPNDKREDLRITDPDAAGWIAISEVTGFPRGGAKSSDLISLSGRFRRRFALEEKREPDSLWYIVNQQFLTPPTSRRKGVGVEQGDIDAFSAEGGLVVDTIRLFRLVQVVLKGEATQAEARERLRQSSGWFELS